MGGVRKPDDQMQANPAKVTKNTDISKKNEIVTSATLDQILKLIETIDKKHKISKTDKAQIDQLGANHPSQIVAALAAKHPELVKHAVSQFMASKKHTEEEKLKVLKDLIATLPKGEEKEQLENFSQMLEAFKEGGSLEEIAGKANALKGALKSVSSKETSKAFQKLETNFMDVLAKINASLQKALEASQKAANAKQQIQKEMSVSGDKREKATLDKQISAAQAQVIATAKAAETKRNLAIAMVVIGVVLAIVGGVIAGLTGGLAAGLVAGLVGIFFAVAASHIEDAIVKAIQPTIEAALIAGGMSKDEAETASKDIAKAIADTIVAVIAIVATLGVGSVFEAGEIVGADIAEQGVANLGEVAADEAEAAAQEGAGVAGQVTGDAVGAGVDAGGDAVGTAAEEGLQESVGEGEDAATKKLSTKILKALAKILKAKGMGKKVVGTTFSSLGQAGVFTDAVNGIFDASKSASESANGKLSQEGQTAFTIIKAIAGALATLGGSIGGGLHSAAGEAETFEELGSDSGTLIARLAKGAGNSAKNAAKIVGAGAQVAGSSVALGFTVPTTYADLDVATTQEQSGQASADALIAKALSSLVQGTQKQMSKADKDLIKELQGTIKIILTAMASPDAAQAGLNG